MNLLRRLKGAAGFGGQTIKQVTVVASSSIQLDEDDRTIYLLIASSGNTSATAFACPKIIPGRRLTLIGMSASAVPTVVQTAVSSTAEGVFHSSGNRALGLYDTLEVIQNDNGSWTEIAFKDVS